MDRESDREDIDVKDRDAVGLDTDDESDTDQQQALLMCKLSEQIERQRQTMEGESIKNSTEEFRRVYEAAENNGHHLPPRSISHSTNNATSAFPVYGPPLTNAAANDRLFPFTIGNYLQSNAAYQQYASSGLAGMSVMQNSLVPSVMSSYHRNIPPPGLASSHLPYQSQSPPNSYKRSPSHYQSPPPAHTQRSASVSSRQSMDESTSPAVQNSWSFEEQFKQLYDIDRDDIKRKEFLDDLFSFMQKHGAFRRSPSDELVGPLKKTPVTRLPIMAKSVLDLYELYKLVVQRGGLVDVINKKLWQEVIKGLNLPSSITSAAFTLRTQYMKFLYRYETAKLGLSSMEELQVAIEGNKREGRRTSYPYGDIGQLQVSGNGNGPIGPPVHHPSSGHHRQPPTISPPVGMVTSPVSGMHRPQINGHGNPHASQAPSNHMMPPIGLQGSSPELPEGGNLSRMDVTTQLAIWNLYNGVMNMKPFLQQPSMIPFQQVMQQAGQSLTNEVPLDLGKRRSVEDEHSQQPMELPPVTGIKREASDTIKAPEDDSEDNDSDSDDEQDGQLPIKTSSQVADEKDIAGSPVVIKMKINGTKYRGVLHPRCNTRKMELRS